MVSPTCGDLRLRPAWSAWLVLLSIWAGVGVGLCLPVMTQAALAVTVVVAVGTVLAASAVALLRPRLGLCLALAGLALGLCCAKTATRPSTPRWALRGFARGLVALEVDGASRPGASCTARLDETTRLRLRWPTPCRLGQGQPVIVRADRLERSPPGPPGRVGSGSIELVPRDGWHRVGARDGGARARYWGGVADLRLRAWSWSRGHDGRALVVAATLGLPGALSPESKRALRGAGLGHLIAVSGLHVGLVAIFVMHLALRCSAGGRAGVWVAAGLGTTVILAFVGITGGAAPAVRAAAMYLAATGGAVLGRPAHRRLILAWVLTVMIVAVPAWIVDPGFSLSAAATWAIVTRDPSGVPGEQTDDARLAKDAWTGAAIELFGMSWRIAWATAAVSTWWFGRVAWVAVLLNVVAIPVFASVVVPFGAAGWLGMVAFGSPEPWITPAVWGGELLLDMARAAAHPSLSVSTGCVLAVGSMWWAVSLAATALGRRPSRLRPPFWCVAALLVVHLAPPATPQLEALVEPESIIARSSRSQARWHHEKEGACLDLRGGVVIDWATWLSVFDAGHTRAVAGDGPEADSVRRALGAVPVDACSDERAARDDTAMLEACRRRFGHRRAVAVRASDGSSWCRSHTGWRSLQ